MSALTPKEARLILSDGGLKTLIRACQESDNFDTDEYLKEVERVFWKLYRMVVKISRKKVAK